MKHLLDRDGNHIGTIMDDKDIRETAEFWGKIIFALICLPFAPIILYYVGKKEREQNGGLSKGRAAAICFFLGAAGLHKFYEGKVQWGILYLFTGGLFIVGYLYDFFTILAHKESVYDPDVKPDKKEIEKSALKVFAIFGVLFGIGLLMMLIVLNMAK